MKVRVGPRVTRLRTDDLDELFAAVAEQMDVLPGQADNASVGSPFKTYSPVERVFARVEIAARRGLFKADHAGIDVRGDGSVEAFTGRARREVVEPLPGESVVDALRRAFVESLA